MKTVNEYVLQYGEEYKTMIETSIMWLEENEPLYTFQINHDNYMQDLVAAAKALSKWS